MRYRHALLWVELGQDAGLALAALRKVAPGLQRLVVVARLQGSSLAGLPQEPSPELAGLMEAAREAAPRVELRLVPELGGEALAELSAAEDIDLLVLSGHALRAVLALGEARRRRPVAVLFAEGRVREGPLQAVCCFASSHHARVAVRTFLRDHAEPSLHVTLLSPPSRSSGELAAMLEVAGIDARVEDSPGDEAALRRFVEEGREVDLVVVARLPARLLLGGQWPTSVLLLPAAPQERRFGERGMDVADVIADARGLRTRVDQVSAVGALPALPDQELAFVSRGRVVATVRTRQGEVELPPTLEASSLGVYRVREGAAVDLIAATELRISVVRAGDRPLILFDAELSELPLKALAELSGPPPPELLAVRLRPTRSCRALRERLRAAGLPARVVDARAVLEEGEALDVSEPMDPVRLARVASRLRAAGFPVTAIFHRGPLQPHVTGFATLSEAQLLGGAPAHPASAFALAGLDAAPIPGNRLELELDNAQARRWLLEEISRSEQRVHFQVYMAFDDDVGAAVEEALAEAGARGVEVRVLVDSLHTFHGSFGISNPFLERLAKRPGIEVRTSRPLRELPSIEDLKLRDHRKVTVVDGRVALVGGRNLAHEYYTSFDEVALTPNSDWREVPWLDGGARVEGPAVAAVDASFLEAWTESGGEPFALSTPAPAGSSTTRVVVHHGLRDASTLEAYRELIDSAQRSLYVLNGFPLLLELQHALLRALRRGVQVRTLIGHLSPVHGGQPFKGPWAAARIAATEFVHSRSDPLIAAGAEVYLYAVPQLPSWAPALGTVCSHVHAKVLSADGLRCAVGSANLDVTACYWESELMLLVEDPAVVRAYDAQMDALLAASLRMSPEDPAWQALAARRAWMRHWPGVLSV